MYVIFYFFFRTGPQLARDNCQLGKFGALVKIETPDMDQVTAALCQHIVGMNPTEVGTPEKPKIEEKMSKKKKKAVKQEEVESKGSLVEEEGQLLRQEFILDPDLTVQKYLEANAPKVVDFVRFECGEVLPGDEED